ncbi:GNAT family N-acetyltransferase [Vibrio profundi]|uniref:GNAT family N-acetyltransferase n=1 Tax=Vibrio profundi TaxID=1774960 RepID=UPI0037351906
MEDAIQVRTAKRSDSSNIFRFINDLANHVKAKSDVKASINDIEVSLFSSDSTAHALICEVNDEAVGFAVYFYSYSTWLGKNGLYLEDLYVAPKYRGIGAGKSILKHLAKLAIENNCGRFEWSVLDWNEQAMDFYKSLGAKPQNESVVYRLAGNDLKNLAR